MFPLPVVMVNCSGPRASDLRGTLSQHGLSPAAEFATVEDLLRAWKGNPVRSLLLVRVQGLKQTAATAKLADSFPGFPIVALIEGTPDASGLYELNRAGAAQMLPYPPDTEDFGRALDRLAAQFGLTVLPARTVAITGATAGCGASFLALNLAAEIATRFSIPTTLVELEFGFGRLPGYLDVSPPVSIRDLLSDPSRLTAASVRAAVTSSECGFGLLAGPHRQVSPFAPEPGRVGQLIALLRRAAPLSLLDLPATFDAAYFEALEAAQAIVLVGRPEVSTIQAMKAVREGIVGRGLREPLVVLNAFDPDLEAFSRKRVASIVGVPSIVAVTVDAAAARSASDAGRPLAQAAPESAALADIRELGAELLRRLGYEAKAVVPAKRSVWNRLFGD